jgi:hypothetical protein
MEQWRQYLKEGELESSESPDSEEEELPKVSYSAVILKNPGDIFDNQDIQKILVENPEFTKKFAHHMTINLSDLDESHGWTLGDDTPLEVVSWGKSDKAIALKIAPPSGMTVQNEIPHITLATTEEGKPVDSNQIGEWDNPFEHGSFQVEGTVEEVRHKDPPKKKKPPREKKTGPGDIVKRLKQAGKKDEQIKQVLSKAFPKLPEKAVDNMIANIKF